MSNRRQAFNQPQANPATKFIDWKSNDKAFEYYDKETSQKVSIPLPFKFLVLDELHSVKGWNDATKSAIYSNEVKFISKELMTVKPYKGNEIAKGLYKDIKEKIVAAGAHYVKSIYIMLEDGSLANLSLKGSSVQKWGEFTQKTRSRLPDEWVVVAKSIEGKKGAVKFNVPDFTFERSISDSEAELADEAFNLLEVYLKAYLVKAEPDAIHVEDENEKIVYRLSNENPVYDDETGEETGESEYGALQIVSDGWMKHSEDVNGLEKYLKELGFKGELINII